MSEKKNVIPIHHAKTAQKTRQVFYAVNWSQPDAEGFFDYLDGEDTGTLFVTKAEAMKVCKEHLSCYPGVTMNERKGA